ncbi:MAG: twin-arginine translocase TatA/TatE family subunit [Phycisphaerales bacterium]|nr:twin-arginine translocase TatA/TatE family subunit [Phycisphaerales bacterium]
MGEWIIILVVMLLLFGRRLPEVGKSLGRGIVEFKKGIKGVEDDVETQSTARPPQPYTQQLPPGQPQQQAPWPQQNQHAQQYPAQPYPAQQGPAGTYPAQQPYPPQGFPMGGPGMAPPAAPQ